MLSPKPNSDTPLFLLYTTRVEISESPWKIRLFEKIFSGSQNDSAQHRHAGLGPDPSDVSAELCQVTHCNSRSLATVTASRIRAFLLV